MIDVWTNRELRYEWKLFINKTDYASPKRYIRLWQTNAGERPTVIELTQTGF